MINQPKLEVTNPKPPNKSADQTDHADCLTLLIASPFLWALRGLVVSYAWLWFVVPLGPPPIGAGWGAGIAIGALLLDPVSGKDKKAEASISDSIAKSLMCWAMLYLAHLCT